MFSNSTKYAIRTLLFIAGHPGSKFTVEVLSTELDIPGPYLSKVLQELSRNKIISSSKGRGGGFSLTKQNMKKKLIDVIMVMEGHNIFEKCLLGLHKCSDKNPCWFHSEYQDFREKMENKVLKQSISQVADLDIPNQW
jgi:Rrf2 family transcriptional regulator, iron-sulfur cluster assembly transcription factor